MGRKKSAAVAQEPEQPADTSQQPTELEIARGAALVAYNRWEACAPGRLQAWQERRDWRHKHHAPPTAEDAAFPLAEQGTQSEAIERYVERQPDPNSLAELADYLAARRTECEVFSEMQGMDGLFIDEAYAAFCFARKVLRKLGIVDRPEFASKPTTPDAAIELLEGMQDWVLERINTTARDMPATAAAADPPVLADATPIGELQPKQATEPHWRFEPGRFWYKSQPGKLNGLPLEILKLFATSSHTAIGYGVLHDLWRSLGKEPVTDEAVKQQVYKVRDALKPLCPDDDPLPFNGDGWEFSLLRP